MIEVVDSTGAVLEGTGLQVPIFYALKYMKQTQ